MINFAVKSFPEVDMICLLIRPMNPEDSIDGSISVPSSMMYIRIVQYTFL